MHCREVAGLCNDVWWVNSIIFCIYKKHIEFVPVGTALETWANTSGVTIATALDTPSAALVCEVYCGVLVLQNITVVVHTDLDS